MITSQEIINILNDFIGECNKITENNIYYKIFRIENICNRYIVSLKSHEYESIAYNFANISNMCKNITVKNYFDCSTKIKNLCIKVVDYINKYGLE